MTECSYCTQAESSVKNCGFVDFEDCKLINMELIQGEKKLFMFLGNANLSHYFN